MAAQRHHATAPTPKLQGRSFFKMTGSGNDFVFFDNRSGQHSDLANPISIGVLCDRRSGIGADGIVLIDAHPTYPFAMRYYNRDGSLAEMCGNAALCTATLARTLGIVRDDAFSFDTPSGPVRAAFVNDEPQIDMVPITELTPNFSTPLTVGERRVGYARVGVPHLVVLVDDLRTVPVVERGRALRWLPTLSDGANVNFVSGTGSPVQWAMRTYERGVEDETLACGTGTVAVAALLEEWGLTADGATLKTESGCTVFARRGTANHSPVLRGEGRLVFAGTLHDPRV